MPLILTGVGLYSTTYLDEEGRERRIKLRIGQDAEALGLPAEVLERLKKLERKAGHKTVPYFTEEGEKTVAAEPPKAASVVKEEGPRNITSAAHMNKVIHAPPVLPESVTGVEQPEEKPEVEEEPTEAVEETKEEPKEEKKPEEKPKKKPAAKKKPGPKKKSGPKPKKETEEAPKESEETPKEEE